MDVVPIPPTSLIEEFSTYHWQFCLSHIADKHPKYLARYKKLGHGGINDIILDNGAFENGSADNLERIIWLADEIKAFEVVLPDRMFMADDTIERSRQAAKIFQERYKDSDMLNIANPRKPALQAVVHGRNVYEWRECLLKLLAIEGIDCIAIPKDYEAWHGGRDLLLDLTIRAIDSHGVGQDIHLLGMEKDVHGYRKFDGINYVRTMDTAKPFIWGYNGANFEASKPDKYPRPENYFDPATEFDIDMIKTSHDNMRIWQDNARYRA